MKRITLDDLVRKLDQLDEALISMWLDDREDFDETDEAWQKFVSLLEARVELLTTLRDAGMALSREMAWPSWLENLSQSRRELMRKRVGELSKQKNRIVKYKKYEDTGKI